MDHTQTQHQRLHLEIYQSYHDSKAMQLAFQTTMNDLIHGKVSWVKMESEKSAPIILQDTSYPWHHFIRKLALQLCLYGYALYRLLRVRGVQKDSTPEDHFHPEVAEGIHFNITFNKETNKWEPETAFFSKSSIKGTRGWKLVILEPPETALAYRYTPNSCGYRSLREHQLGQRLLQNMVDRDTFNSKPSVFTQITKNLTPSSAQGRPWFNAVNSSMLPAPQAITDFNTMVQDRATTIEQLDTLSERARLNTHRQYSQNALQLRVGNEGGHQISPMQHQEFFVSDGREGNAVGFLQGLENFSAEYERCQNNILFMWGVPPQVLGKNINTERLSSNNRLTEMAITHYESHLKILSEHVQLALKTLSTMISGNDSTYIKIIPCMSQYTLAKIEPILKTKICMEQYACVFDLPETYFDMEALKIRQQTINEAGAQKERVEETQKKVSTRPEKTEAQKDDTSKSKAEVTGS